LLSPPKRTESILSLREATSIAVADGLVQGTHSLANLTNLEQRVHFNIVTFSAKLEGVPS